MSNPLDGNGVARRYRALDLFSCAGGAAMGLHRAGFEVVGVDIRPQPRYPFEFHQADALTFPLDGFDFIWASPPCQGYTELRHAPGTKGAPQLIDAVRERMPADTLWTIENVEDAKWAMRGPVLLCGSMFALGAQGCQLQRHRLFESNFYLPQPDCQHGPAPVIGVYGGPRAQAVSKGWRARHAGRVGRRAQDCCFRGDGDRLDDAWRNVRGHPARLCRVHRPRRHRAHRSSEDRSMTDERTRSPAPSHTAVEPVAYRVKDFADGWILVNSRNEADYQSREMSGALIEPLVPLSALTAQAAALAKAEGRVEALMAERTSLIATKREQLAAAESEVATLKARVAELEAGLEPFANRAFKYDGSDDDWFCTPSVQVKDLRRARRLTHQEKNNG